MKQPISAHKEKLSLFRKLIDDRGDSHPIAKAFNIYANELEAKIKSAEQEGLTSFDEAKYKVKLDKNGWFE